MYTDLCCFPQIGKAVPGNTKYPFTVRGSPLCVLGYHFYVVQNDLVEKTGNIRAEGTA